MTPPLIGLSGRRAPATRLRGMTTALLGCGLDVHIAEYASSVVAAGGLPVQLTREAPAEQSVARLEGLVLTGGADVDPSCYGEEPEPDLGAIEEGRDQWEMALVVAALDLGVPVLGVCRGAQLLNVALGGSLVQHLPDTGVLHPAWEGGPADLVHEVRFRPGSLAGSLYGERRVVNSLHHQACARLGRGVEATGTAPDGVVEAIEVPDRAVLGVQWHPELLVRPDPAFVWLVGEAARFRSRRPGD